MSIPLTLMDPDDLNLILDWLIERYSTEPDPKDFFENAARDDHNNLQAFARGIDHQTSVHRYDSAKTNAFFQCFEAANLANAHQLLPKLASLLWCAERFMNIEDYVEQLTNIFEHLLRFAPPPFAALKILADCDDAEFRLVAAKHLGGQTEHERKLLRKLLRDNDNRIRAAANKALTRSGASQWWQASFTQDPSEHIHDDDTAQQAVKDWIQLCSTDYGIHSNYIPSHSPPILALMPEPVRCDALRVYLRNPDTLRRAAATFGPILMQCEGGAIALNDTISYWGKTSSGYYDAKRYISDLLANASPQQLKILWQLCLDTVLGPTPKSDDSFDSPADFKAHVVVRIWPPDEPLDPLIERMERPRLENALDSVAHTLQDALAKRFSAERIPWTLIEDRICNRADSYWTLSRYGLSDLLLKAPPDTLERIAQHWLHHGDPRSLAWVLKRTLFLESISGEEWEQNLYHCWNDDRFRTAILTDVKIIERSLPWFLSRLRAADATFTEAALFLRTLGKGNFPPDSHASLVTNLYWIAREDLRSFNAPEKPLLDPPLLTEEWTQYRLLRDQITHQDKAFWKTALEVLPANPTFWEPSDQALIQKAKSLWNQGAKEIDTLTLVSAVYALGGPTLMDDLALFSFHPGGLPQDDDISDILLAVRTKIALSLGLAPPEMPSDEDDEYDENEDEEYDEDDDI